MKIQYFLRYEERKICECRFEGDGEKIIIEFDR